MNRPPVAPPAPWSFPRPAESVLDNGLRVLAFHRPGQHVVSATLVLDLPLSVEPAAHEGVAGIVQRCLDEGTRSHPGTSFAETLESAGAVLSGGLSHTATHLTLEVPTTRLGAALPLFAEAVREPELAAGDVERHLALRLAEIEQSLAHPAHRAALAFRENVIAPEFRASRPAGGSPDTVAAITPAEVAAFHDLHYRPDRAVLVLAGDLTDDPLPSIRAAFGGWTGSAAAHPSEVPHAGVDRCLLIDRPGAVQAEVRLGGFGIDRTDPRWAALRVGCHALGGGFLSRLNRVLREERGYTYGVHLTPAAMRHGGLVTLHGSFRTEVAVAALTEARELIDLSGERGLTEAEIRDAIAYTVGVTPLRYATAGGVSDQVAALVDAGLPAAWLDAHAAAMAAVTPQAATEALGSLLPADALHLVVVGDAERLADPLRAAGWDLSGP